MGRHLVHKLNTIRKAYHTLEKQFLKDKYKIERISVCTRLIDIVNGLVISTKITPIITIHKTLEINYPNEKISRYAEVPLNLNFYRMVKFGDMKKEILK